MKKIIGIASILLANLAFASADNPEANFDYKIVNNKSTSSISATQPNAKVEVIEFFSFACGHCYAFDPYLKEWVEKNKTNINFKRIPVDFGGVYAKYQKLFYTLEIMGKLDTLHDKVFDSIHKDAKSLDKQQDLIKFAKDNNIDSKQLLSTYNSFAVATKAKQASKIAQDYQIDGVPTILIGGKYITSSQMVGGREEVLKIMNHLVTISKKK